MKSIELKIVLLLSAVVGCGDSVGNGPVDSEPRGALIDGSTVELIGIAAFAPDRGDKAMVDAVIHNGTNVQFDGQYERLPAEVIGSKIHVTGTIRKRRAPMFIYDDSLPATPAPQGIPMPPGTDIEKESVYFVVENPQWRRIANERSKPE